jgi:hypothetical protein
VSLRRQDREALAVVREAAAESLVPVRQALQNVFQQFNVQVSTQRQREAFIE